MTETCTAYYESPIGLLEIKGGPAGVSAVGFVEARAARAGRGARPDAVEACLRQIDEYFRGGRRSFTVKLDLRGTDFQKKVWRALRAVRFGRTASYGDIAAAVGRPGAARAVGGANHANPVAIVVPCHRIVGSDGRLTGYGAGVWRKDWLLRHEGHDSLKI